MKKMIIVLLFFMMVMYYRPIKSYNRIFYLNGITALSSATYSYNNRYYLDKDNFEKTYIRLINSNVDLKIISRLSIFFAYIGDEKNQNPNLYDQVKIKVKYCYFIFDYYYYFSLELETKDETYQ